MRERPGNTTAAVLISGGGSNLQSFIDAVRSGQLDLELTVAVSSNPAAYGLERARRAGLRTECVPSRDYPERKHYDAALAATLERYQPDLLLLAGFMRILTPDFVRRYRGRMLNIHPSQLPHFPGLDTHRRALAAGERRHGCTVHFVTEELDAGPAVMQAEVAVEPGDTPDALAARVLTFEHKIYPEAAALLAAGRLSLKNGDAWLDGRLLAEPLKYDDNTTLEHS